MLKALVVGWMLACFAGAQAAAPTLDGVDVYGTRSFDATFIRSHFAKELAALAAASAANDSAAGKRARDQIEQALLQRGELAFVTASLIFYAKPSTMRYLTIDVVERSDRERRMPFFDTPQGKPQDPEGLLPLWAEYNVKAMAIIRSGNSGTASCEVLHCLVPFAPHPELLPYLALFNDKVQRSESELYNTVANGSSNVDRGNAIYLLAHSKDADRLLQALGRAIYDPSSYVRNNAMRVMAWIADRDPERAYPVEDLVRAMDFATATDRNKAAYTLTKLVKSPRHREAIAQSALPSALRLLRLEQPINHEPALELLRSISGEAIGARDYAAWDAWFARYSAPGKAEEKF